MDNMKNNMPCEIIEDLLPSYAEELTSEVTNEYISAHLQTCENCNRKYKLMKNPVKTGDNQENAESKRETAEIDFLKKTKKNTQKKILVSAAVIWLIAIVFMVARYLFAGTYMNTEYLGYNLDVAGNEMTISVHTPSQGGIQRVEITESEGVIEVSVRGVQKGLFYKNTVTKSFVSSQEIRQIWIGDRIIWADGVAISPLTSSLYAVYNPYVGNMPSNGKIINALNMTTYTGNFTNELHTSSEPYSWTLYLEQDFSSERTNLEDRIKSYAYIILADIGNLNEVIFDYKVDGESKQLSVTAADATAFLGSDIKEAGENVVLLETLVQKTGLSNVVIGGAAVEKNNQVDYSMSDDVDKVIQINVVNYADDEVYGVFVEVECDKAFGNQGMSNADNSALKEGEVVPFQLLSMDFNSDNIENGSEGKISLTIYDKAGNSYEAQGDITVDINWGMQYRVNLSGNAKAGYLIGQ